MTTREPAPLDQAARERARALGVETYLRKRTFGQVRKALFRRLDASVASAPVDEPLMAVLVAAVDEWARNYKPLMEYLRGRKASAARGNREASDEWFALLSHRIAEEYERARGPRGIERLRKVSVPIRAPNAELGEFITSANERLSWGHSTPALYPSAHLRRAAARFQHCTGSEPCACTFAGPWCRNLSDRPIAFSSYAEPEVRRFGDDETSVPLRQAFHEWLTVDDRPKHMLLLGEYGIGKTAACLRLFRRLARDAAAGRPGAPVPVYVPLDAFAEQRPASGRLADLLKHAIGLDHLPDELDPSVPAADRVFLLDGLDEMSGTATVAGIRRNLEFLRPFLRSGSRVVLTCRTHLFSSAADLATALRDTRLTGDVLTAVRADDYEIVELLTLPIKAVKAVIACERPDEDPDAILRELRQFPDLPGLLGRPVLLGLLLGSLPEIRERHAQGLPIDEAALYDVYVEHWALGAQEHRVSPFSVDEKLDLAKAIAVRMHHRGVTTIDAPALKQLIRERHRDAIHSTTDIDRFDYDTRDAAFLTCDLRGAYSFTHGSFREYFAARAFRAELRAGTRFDAWGSGWLGQQAARFVAQMVQSPLDPEAVRRLIQLATVTDDEIVLWNALHILSLVDPDAIGGENLDAATEKLVARGFADPSAVAVRQYARVAAKFRAASEGSALIDRVLEIVAADPDERAANNATYVNYYGGVAPACWAFLGHLSEPVRKYDRHLHLHLLGQLGSPVHAVTLRERSTHWETDDAERAMLAVRQILARARGESDLSGAA